jgi:hypothetical protein
MTEKRRGAAGYILLLASAALIAAGLFLGQNHAVFIKAANICLECIGVG